MSPTQQTESFFGRAAFWLTGGAAVSVLFSIAACQILIALAFAALLLSDAKLRLPPVRLPLALFIAGTIVSLLLSDDPSAGRPQLRKFFVFLMLLIVYSTFRELAQIRRLALCWAGVGALVSARGLVQFAEKYGEARFRGQNFYEYYVGERITGFMSHWMTFGGQIMIVLLLLAAFVLFSPMGRRKLLWFSILCAAPISAALLLGFTRSIWIATGAAGLYLLWSWRKIALLAVPVLLLAGIWFSPDSVKSRFVSMFKPRREDDSNQHRIVCWRTGWEMIKAHPWFGLGPEQVKNQFNKYVPRDISWPLPAGWYGHLHNIYIHYAAERGVPATLVLIWLLVKILFDFLRALRRIPPGPNDARFVLHGAVAVMISILVSGVFELNLGDSEVLTLFLAVVAAGYVARDHVLQEASVG